MAEDKNPFDFMAPAWQPSAPSEVEKKEEKPPQIDLNQLLGVLKAQGEQIAALQSAALTRKGEPADIGSQDDYETGGLDLSGLPDPVLEQDKFAEDFTNRVEGYIGERVHEELSSRASEQETEAEFGRRAAGLWEEFQGTYPQFKGMGLLASSVATALSDAAASKGIDVNEYMFGAGKNRFFEDARKVMEDQIKLYNGGTALSEPASDRTQGFDGGLNAPPVNPKGDKAQKGDMLTDLKGWQLKSGFF